MAIFKLFKRSRKQSIESLQFFYFLSEVNDYFVVKYQKSNNWWILNFLKVFDWLYLWQLDQISDYVQCLRDYSFWRERQYYRENLEKFVAGELSGVQIVDRVLYQILSNEKEAENYYSTSTPFGILRWRT